MNLLIYVSHLEKSKLFIKETGVVLRHSGFIKKLFMVFRTNDEVFMKSYREMNLNDLALSIILMTKVLRDRIAENRTDAYPVKKEIIESMKNLIDTLEKIEEIQHYPL